jgi:hypothetical protein
LCHTGDIGFLEKPLKKIVAQCEPKLEENDVQVLMPPVLQSGGNYDLKWSAQTDEEVVLTKLHETKLYVCT